MAAPLGRRAHGMNATQSFQQRPARVLRTTFACLLAIVALVLLIGQVGVSLEHDPREALTPLEHVILAAIWLCTGATAVYYFRSRAFWDGRMACPHCKQSGSLQLSVVRPSRISLVGWILGGVIGSLLYSHSRKHQFLCGACSQSCELRSPGSRLALVWLLFLVLLIIIEIVAHSYAA